jgi:two-component system, NarL family, sensor kinase
VIARRGGSPTRSDKRMVWRSIAALVITAAFSFVAVGSAAIYVAKRISRDEVLSEAGRSARRMGDAVFAPMLPAALKGDATAIAFLDRAVKIRSKAAGLVRVKVWSPAGQVVYSDDHPLIGRVFELEDEVNAALARNKSSVGVSYLDQPENVDEAREFDDLVEAYVPLQLEDGTRLVFETYSTDAQLHASERRLTGEIVPLALGALLLLVLTQLPVAVWLIRRVARAEQDRSRILANSLAVSERERRAIARDLHDGVVQDLAGAGYALGALARSLPGPAPSMSRTMLDMSSAAVERSVRGVRTLIVDIDLPDLTADGLEAALADQAALRASPTTAVTVRTDLSGELPPEVVALVYRAARESLTNIAKHAAATQVTIELTGDDDSVRLKVTDDGRGLPTDWSSRRANGHVGVKLLADAARDLGGDFRLEPAPSSGTTALLVLPRRPVRDD